MKNRTRRWLILARNWGIFIGILLIIWITLLIARPNIPYAITEKYFHSRKMDRLSEMTHTDFIEDICDPQTEITYYSLDALMRGECEREDIRFTDGLYILNDRYYIHNMDFEPLLEETSLDGYGTVTMVRGAAQALQDLLTAAEAETGERFRLGDSYIDGAVPEKDHGNDCYLLDYYETSEHITGTSIDLLVDGVDFRTYMRADLSKWLQDNAWRFGFTIRYPFWEGEWTGVFFQPWHIHYVGMPHAALLYKTRMPLEEYLEKNYTARRRYYMIDYTGEDGTTDTYVIYRQTPTEGTIYIPDTLSDVEVSFDNTYGYYYVTGVLS